MTGWTVLPLGIPNTSRSSDAKNSCSLAMQLAAKASFVVTGS